MIQGLVMQERQPPSRPMRLGTRRRKPRQAVSAVPEAGASRFGGTKAPSLDTEKQLATTDSSSVREWQQSQEDERDVRRSQEAVHARLIDSVFKIYQMHLSRPLDDGEAIWWASYQAEQRQIEGESEADRWRRLEKWIKKNKATGRNADVLKWEKQYSQLQRCQSEWIGYRYACCGERSGVVAVPVGCNHRLCPLCSYYRSQNARTRIKSMFDRLTHPVLLTLTIPNQTTIRKHDFTFLRQKIRKFIAQRKELVLGGVYSIETTYNRTEKTWHMHAHVLCDFARPLPTVREKQVDFFGKKVFAFTAMKWRWEFDWACLWIPSFPKMPSMEPPQKGLMKWRFKWDGYLYEFENWVGAKREHSNAFAKQWEGKRMVSRTDLSPAELERYQANAEWNAENTRVIDMRPVNDRDGAAREVLKYITKSADFCDVPEAIEPFCNAVKGARLIQTFGTWYGVDFTTDFDTRHLEDWGENTCACGLNMRERIGVFHRHDVEMDPDGRWRLKAQLNHNCGGTVPRPTIGPPRAREGDAFIYV